MRRGDRIEPRLQRFERFDKCLGMRTDAGKFLQHGHDIECGGITVGIFALRQRPRLFPIRTAGNEGDQFEQGIRRRRQRDVVGQHLAQRLAVDFGGVRRAEQGDDLVDQPEIVARENAEGVADDIIEAATGQVEIDMPGFLFRTLLVQQAARDEFCRDRIVARAAGLRHDHRHRRYGSRRRRWGGRRLVQLLIQRLQHPRGFLAAGDAEIEPRFALACDRVRIVVAIIAALAAILLRHRRHHASPQRPAFGKFHAVSNRHGLVMPWRFAVIAVTGRALHDGGALLGGQRRRSVGQQSGEESVQPGTLCLGERRA